MKFIITSFFLATTRPPVDPSADFSPMMLFMTLIAFCVMLIMIGICIAIAVIAAVSILILTALGILSTAALTGIFRRKFSSGLRALHYQVCAAIALPAGAALFWIVARLFDSTFPLPGILAFGALAGICAGVLIAFILDRAAITVCRHIEKTKSARNPNPSLSPRISSAPPDPSSQYLQE